MTKEAFLQSIDADPGDFAARMVYADWLEDNGEPARADLIRLGVQRDALIPLDAQRVLVENQIAQRWAEHGPVLAREDVAWRTRGYAQQTRDRLACALRSPEAGDLDRGFVRMVEMSADRINEDLPQDFLQVFPHIRLTQVTRQSMEALLAREDINALAGLAIRDQSLLGYEDLLWETDRLQGLRELDLAGSTIVESLEVLMGRSAWARQLRTLILRGLQSEMTDWFLDNLANIRLPRLRVLDLSGHEELDSIRARTLPRIPNIRDLYLRECMLDDVDGLLRRPHKQLRALDVRGNRLGHNDLYDLSTAANLPALQILAGSGNVLCTDNAEKILQHMSAEEHLGAPISWTLENRISSPIALRSPLLSVVQIVAPHILTDPELLRQMAESDRLGALECISLDTASLTDDDIPLLLAIAKRARLLRTLDLSLNSFSRRGCKMLAQAPELTHLHNLVLDHNPLGPGGIEALLETSHGWPELACLSLDNTGIGDALSALAEYPWNRLNNLGIASSAATPAVMDAFLQSPLIPRLRHLAIAINPLSRTQAELLLSRATNAESLDLESCNLRSLACMREATCKRLRTLVLSCNPLGDPGIRVLCKVLPDLPSLSAVQMRDCNITDAGAQHLLDALGTQTRRLEVSLNRNPDISDGMRARLKAAGMDA